MCTSICILKPTAAHLTNPAHLNGQVDGRLWFRCRSGRGGLGLALEELANAALVLQVCPDTVLRQWLQRCSFGKQLQLLLGALTRGGGHWSKQRAELSAVSVERFSTLLSFRFPSAAHSAPPQQNALHRESRIRQGGGASLGAESQRRVRYTHDN